MRSDDQFEELETEPSNEDLSTTRIEPWIVYQRREYGEYLQKTFYGAIVVDASTPKNIATFTNLFAQTQYQNYCYLDDLRGNISDSFIGDWATQNLYDAVTFEITVAGEVSLTYLSALKDATATALGISTYRPIDGQRVFSRRLQDSGVVDNTTFKWTIPDTRYVESPSPSEVADISVATKVNDKEYLEQ